MQTSIHYYLGKPYPITIHSMQPSLTLHRDGFHIPDGGDVMIKRQLAAWYREQALDIIMDRVTIYATKMKVSYQKITLKYMKTRWGSCSHQGNLNFNWTLIMAPLEVIDYVVVHELAHRIQFNHSPAFWALVNTHIPTYKTHIRWLKQHHRLLIWDTD